MDYSWLIFALLSAITAALVAIFGKIGLQNVDSTTATAIRAIIMAIFLFLVILVEGKVADMAQLTLNSKAMLFIILSGVAGALSWLFYFFALKLGKVSQIVPIDRLSIVFALILAAIFLGESMNWKTGLGTALVVAGAIVIALA